MEQTAAALLVLSASVFSYAALTAQSSGQSQASAALVVAAIVVGLWGMISLFAATMQENAALMDSRTRLQLFERVINVPARLARYTVQKLADRDVDPRSRPRHGDRDATRE